MDLVKFIINLIIFLFYFFNFILLEKHFLKHYCSNKKNNKKIIIFWFDYTFTLIIIIIISFFKIFQNTSLISIENKIFLYFPLFYSNQFILNILLSMQLIYKIKKTKKKIIPNLNSDIHNILFYFIKQFFIMLIEGAFIFYFKYKVNKTFYLISIFHSSLILFSIIMSFIVSKTYKNFLYYNKSFDCHHVLQQKQYTHNRQNILVSIEHYFYKNICDILLNFPCIILYSNTKLRTNFRNVLNDNENENDKFLTMTYLDLYFYLIALFGILYLYIFGIMLLNLDYLISGYTEKILNILFCIKKYHFYFGQGKNTKHNIIFNRNFKKEYISYLNEASTNKNSPKILNNSSSYSESDDGINSSSSDSDSEKEVNEFLEEKNMIKYEYSPCNFFIIYKLLYLYYKINKNTFLELEKINDNNISIIDNNMNTSMTVKNDADNSQIVNSMHSSIKSEEEKKYKKIRYNSLFQKRNKGKALNVNIKDYNITKEKIDNISKISNMSKKKLILSKNYNLDELCSNIEEQNMKKYFIKYIYDNLNKNNMGNISKSFSVIKEKDESLFSSSYEIEELNKNKSNNNNYSFIDKEIIFSIKSLTNDDLLDVNPYYNLKIKDIIKSLDISNNMKLFEKFSEEKYKNESYNNYYTNDTLLSFEIYDEEEFFSSKQLNYFISAYKSYLLDKLTNFSYSFLPLIIGIFKIRYLSYNKIIVLLRNPLTFSFNKNFYYWLKVSFNDKDRKIETSIDKKDIINLDDIESSNNIILENNEYKNSMEILDNDLSFLQNSIKFNMNFNLNIFVLNDEYKNNDLFYVDKSEMSSVKNNLNDNNLTNNVLDRIMQESITSFPCDDSNHKKFNPHKKYFGSDDICLLEKLYVNELVNNRYIFKIYFSNIFMKRNIDENEVNKKNNLQVKGNNEVNSSTSSFIIEEYEEDKENIIHQNNLKYCESIKLKLIKDVNRDRINTFDYIS